MSIRVLAEWLGALLAPYEPIFKVISYVIGPTIAVVAFIWNRKDRRELIAKAEELGTAKAGNESAKRDLENKRGELTAARANIDAKATEVEKLRADLRKVTEGSAELWKLREPKAFAQYPLWFASRAGAKVITFGNLKGGVGKTTLAANFAAYLSHNKNKPVLLVDLDYQGSLSNMCMLAIGKEEVESRVDLLFDERADLATIDRAVEHLAPVLGRAWLVPANYTFAQLENRLLLSWLLKEDGGIDVRYRLAHALLSPEVRRKYAAIIFDMPPRMTLGSVNALVASHYFVVPTALDKLSAEAVEQFIQNMKAIKKDLDLDIDLAGIAGVMSRQVRLSDVERGALERAREGGMMWEPDRDYVFKSTLPRRVDIANAAGGEFAYFGKDNDGPLSNHFDPLFAEICNSVWKGMVPSHREATESV